ncbi:MAG TPA: hypothetical protein VMF62_02810 [Acetobacteraceae bacterium]|jgi:hypothetical protein|nr:hypothetical protein [Acetobacteraceae bacterium]
MSEQKIVTELKVSGHLMKLDPGLYCVFHGPNGHSPNPATGLPGVRISLPPGVSGANGGVEISGFREDGWVSTDNDAALIRVSDGPAQVLVTVYQSALGGDALPQLQVVRLGDIRPNGAHAAHHVPPAGAAVAGEVGGPVTEMAGVNAPHAAPPAARPPDAAPAVTAHVQRRGDVGGRLGEWVGERGSKLWIEGFAVLPPPGLRPEDIEYQGVLGRGWLSPWSQGGQFCGSRRMALPILGIRVRLRGAAVGAFECSYSASFTDGSSVGPVSAGEPCESEALAPLEAFQVTLRPAQQAGGMAERPEPPSFIGPARNTAPPPMAGKKGRDRAAEARLAAHAQGKGRGKRPARHR